MSTYIAFIYTVFLTNLIVTSVLFLIGLLVLSMIYIFEGTYYISLADGPVDGAGDCARSWNRSCENIF